jgi:hypothetical protein
MNAFQMRGMAFIPDKLEPDIDRESDAKTFTMVNFWAIFGQFWSILGQFWGNFGAIFGQFLGNFWQIFANLFAIIFWRKHFIKHLQLSALCIYSYSRITYYAYRCKLDLFRFSDGLAGNRSREADLDLEIRIHRVGKQVSIFYIF